MPTQAELLRRLNYNPETGSLTWRELDGMSPQLRGRLVGKEAGVKCFRRGGKPHRIWLEIDSAGYSAHSIIWIMMNGDGTLPEHIDHKDGNPHCNKWLNLRGATHAQNMRNRNKMSRNKSGMKGVCFVPAKKARSWAASIRVDKKLIHLGYHFTKGLAAVARAKAAIQYHGQFAKFQ